MDPANPEGDYTGWPGAKPEDWGGDDRAPRPRRPRHQDLAGGDPGSMGTQRARTTSPETPAPQSSARATTQSQSQACRERTETPAHPEGLREIVLFLKCFFVVPNGMWDLSSPTRDGTRTPCGGSTES